MVISYESSLNSRANMALDQNPYSQESRGGKTCMFSIYIYIYPCRKTVEGLEYRVKGLRVRVKRLRLGFRV